MRQLNLNACRGTPVTGCVPTIPADEAVGTCTAVEFVIAVIAEQTVIACQPMQHILPNSTEQEVASVISDKNVVERGSSEPFDRRTIRISYRTTRVDLGIAETGCQTLRCAPITDDREFKPAVVMFVALQFIDVIVEKLIVVVAVEIGREETGGAP